MVDSIRKIGEGPGEMAKAPFQVWLQRVDEFSVEQGEQVHALDSNLKHAQMGDILTDPRIQSTEWYAKLEGDWQIQDRVWRSWDRPGFFVSAIVLYIRKV